MKAQSSTRVARHIWISLALVVLVVVLAALSRADSTRIVQAQNALTLSATASELARTSATLNATIQGGAGQQRTVYFRWRAGATGGWAIGRATGVATVRLTLTGLTPATAYKADVSLASDYAGATRVTFTTLANNPPTFPYAATTLSATASELARTSATLNATIQGGAGQQRTVYFRWRAGATGGWAVGRATGVATVRLELTGLTPATAYTADVSLASDYAGATRVTFTTLANNPPTFPYAATTLAVLEGNGPGNPIATPVTATDPDGDTLTYSLSGTDAASFEVQENGRIVVGRGLILDYAQQQTYSLTLTASDSYQGSASISLTIQVEAGTDGADSGTPPILTKLRDLICLGGFPGCPDSFVFLLPTILLGGILLRKETRKMRRVEVLGGIWITAFLVLGISLGMDTLRLIGFCIVAVAVGMVFMAIRRT